MSDLQTLIAEPWSDWGLIDCGNGQKLERYGAYKVVRPEPQAMWAPARSDWDPDATFVPGSDEEGGGRWIQHRRVPKQWELSRDGVKFHGRGYIQLTGRANYKAMSELAGVDLIANPDAALEPDAAAKIFSRYFRSHGCDVLAQRASDASDRAEAEELWKALRRKVNGGLNGYTVFRSLVQKLMALS